MAKQATRNQRAQRNVRRTALMAGAVAVAFYIISLLWH